MVYFGPTLSDPHVQTIHVFEHFWTSEKFRDEFFDVGAVVAAGVIGGLEGCE